MIDHEHNWFIVADVRDYANKQIRRTWRCVDCGQLMHDDFGADDMNAAGTDEYERAHRDDEPESVEP